MSDVYKIIPTLIIVFIIIGLSLVFYFKYKKTPQPTKEEAYRRGLGYYTVEESLGCVNDNLSCTEPGEETFIQYCIPNPTTGRGCINLDGVETYDTSIRKKPCNVNCQSHKFVVEDKVQVKNPGTLLSADTEVIGSGCNKIVDEKLGIDYTDFFLGEYNVDSENPNTYQLKSCVPNEGFAGYYQKIYTCQRNDPKGQNNCVFTCGSEGNVLGLNGLFGSKLSKNLLKYFPVELDYSGGKRYVCYDLNGVDQIDILNYTNTVPKDFIYPDFCYKHSTVNNYNGDLWPNSDASNVFQLPITSLQPEKEYFTVDGTSLAPLFGDNGLLTDTYEVFKDYNSYVKILIGNEIAILNKVIQLNDPSYSLNLSYGNTPEELLTRDNYSLIFYLNVESITGPVFTKGQPLYFSSNINEPITGFEYTGNNFSTKSLDIDSYEFIQKPGERFTYNGNVLDMYTYDTIKDSSATDNPFVIFSFLPIKSYFNETSTENTFNLSFININFNTVLGSEEDKYVSNPAYIYFEVNTDGQNYPIFAKKKDITPPVSNPHPEYILYTYQVTLPIGDNFKLKPSSKLTSQIYMLNSEIQLVPNTETDIRFFRGSNAANTFQFNLKGSFKTGNVTINNGGFVEGSNSLSNGTAQLKYKNSDLVEKYTDGNTYSLSSGSTFSVKWTENGVSKTVEISFTFKSNGVYTTIFLGKNYEFRLNNPPMDQNNNYIYNIFDTSGTEVGGALLNKLTFVITFEFNTPLNYIATPSNPLLFTTLFYVYGNNSAPNLQGDTNYYFWYPLMLTQNTDVNNSVSFTNYPDYNFKSVNIQLNGFFPPSNTEEFTYLDFDEYSGIGNVNFEYFTPSNPSNNIYFIRNLTRDSSLGNYRFNDLELYLYNTDILRGNDDNNFQIYNNSSLYEQVSSINTLQLIRRDSPYFNYVFSQSDSGLNYKRSKIKEYMTMISGQNNGFSPQKVRNNDTENFELIITPQQTVILAADYSVFKSPYKINEDGSLNYLCYNDNGAPLAKGTRITLGENEKMYVNKSCSDYNTNTDSTCGVQGLITGENGTSVSACIQERKTQNVNFSSDCLNYTQDKYNTLDGLFEQGIVLREMFKAKVMGGQEDENVNVFEDFFTREENDSTIYKPNQELYINKNKQNFYLSLKNNNTDFVVEPSSWERVFTYQNLTKSVTFQTHLDTQNYISTLSSINLGLGTINITPYEVPGNFEYRMIFKNSTTGINTESYIYSGLEFYYDINNGNNYNMYRYSSFIQGGFKDRKSPEPVTQKPGIWDANMIRLRGYVNSYTSKTEPFNILTNDYDNIGNHLLTSPNNYNDSQKTSSQSNYSYSLPIYPDNINTYVANATIVSVTSNNKTEKRIKFTITDNNLGKGLTNVSVGDYVNIDSNFFSQLFFNLLGNGETDTQTQKFTLVYAGSNPKSPTTVSSGTITYSRDLHIYGNVPLVSTDPITLAFVSNIARRTSVDSQEGDIFVVSITNSMLSKQDFNTFVQTTNIELFDILGVCSYKSTDNIYLIKIIGIEKIKDNSGNVTEIKYTTQQNLNNDFVTKTTFLNSIIINFKKGSPSVQEIIDISGNKFSFYFDIDDFNISSFVSDTKNNLIYDSKTINYSDSIISKNLEPNVNNEPSINVPLNTFNYKLSFRYIKKETQIPFDQINNSLYAAMTRKDDFDFFDTKLASYVTEFTAQNEGGTVFYYFKEFREDYGYRNPQIEKTFGVGDVIEYITKDNASGTNTNDDYTTNIVASFKVVSVDDNDVSVTLTKKDGGCQVDTIIKYDYKCTLVESIDSTSTNSPFDLSKNKIHLYNSSNNNVVRAYSTYHQYTDGNGNQFYQLPYIGYPYDVPKAQDLDDTIRTGFIFGNSITSSGDDNNEVVYYSKFGFKSDVTFYGPIKTGNTFAVGFPPLYINHDYIKSLGNIRNDSASSKTSDILSGLTAEGGYVSAAKTLLVMYPGSYIRGNRLDVLRLSSTTLRSTKNPSTDYININIGSISAKPYGSEVVLKNDFVSKTNQVNHNRMGNINSFSIFESNIKGSIVGDVFESNKGFQLILTDVPPSKYEFVSIENNNKILQYETETDQIITPYNLGSIVSIVDRSVRQYFRNNTEEDSKFNFKLQTSSNFEIVPKTVYPQDGFIDYNENIYLQKGEIVRYNDPKELSGLYAVEKSNFGVSINSEDQEYYTYEVLTKEMKSNNQNFYSFVYQGDEIEEGEQLNNILEKTRDLNLTNLPLQIKTYDGENTKTNYCPTFCTKKQPSNKTVKQIIDESFVGQLPYFDDIRYIFETPVLVKKDTSKTYLTLGNVPVSYNQNNEYNTTFLSSSNDSTNLLSEFLYFLDLDNDKKIYNKPSCNQDFTYYNESNPGGVSTGVSSFEFSNSLMFQFVPCDIDSQDYISYGVSDNNLVTLNDSNNIFQWNKFPPVTGVTASGGTSIPLINGTSTNVFTGVSGTFETSYLTTNIGISVGDSVTLNKDSSNSVKLTVTSIGNTLEGIGVSGAITSSGTCYSYGDIWYLTQEKNNDILTYGFVVPDIDNGKLTEQSFVQVKDFFSPPENCVINISSNTGSGFSMTPVSGYQYISDYTLESISGVSSGSYTGSFGGETIELNVKYNGSDIVQRNQAVFTSSDTVNPGTSLYFPSYNAKKTIKTKALASFGSNYLGNIKYNNKGFRSLENKIVPTSVFLNYNNTVFTNDIANSSAIVLANNKNLHLTNLLDVIKIDFEGNKFSMQLNNFSRPISQLNSNLMQRNIINLGAISSNSVNRLISDEIKDMVGVSVRLSLAQLEEHNTVYNPSNNIIPGNTNTQIQIKEIRQNRTTDYIDPSNTCSIFFEPEIEPTKTLDGDSVFLSSDNKSNTGDFINITVTNQKPYNITGAGINRFFPKFETSIVYKPNETISFYAGNNLIYYFDQTDSSNNGFPLVFSSDKGANFFSNIINLQKDITPGTVKISYFLDFKEVDPSIYRHVPTFNSSTEERKIVVIFQTDFSEVTSVNTDIYYGFNQANGDLNGGLIKFIYH